LAADFIRYQPQKVEAKTLKKTDFQKQPPEGEMWGSCNESGDGGKLSVASAAQSVSALMFFTAPFDLTVC